MKWRIGGSAKKTAAETPWPSGAATVTTGTADHTFPGTITAWQGSGTLPFVSTTSSNDTVGYGPAYWTGTVDWQTWERTIQQREAELLQQQQAMERERRDALARLATAKIAVGPIGVFGQPPPPPRTAEQLEKWYRNFTAPQMGYTRVTVGSTNYQVPVPGEWVGYRKPTKKEIADFFRFKGGLYELDES